MKFNLVTLFLFAALFAHNGFGEYIIATEVLTNVHDYPPISNETPPGKEDEKDQFDEFIDLEEMPQPFILETKELRFNEFPTAFNPTIVRWNGSLLLAFRMRDPITSSTDGIGMVWLDENMKPLCAPVLLEVPVFPSLLPSKQQDPRLITIGADLYMVYNNVIKGLLRKEIRRVMITKVHYDNGRFYTDPPEMIVSFEGEKEQRDEKNWTPFEYHGELHLIYSLTPHRIEKYLEGQSASMTAASSHNTINWDWGTLRGGTQAYRIEDKYLSFFHSSKNMITRHSKGKNIQHYFMGAYTFSEEPPFEIKEISPEPIVGKGFYSGPEYKTWKPLRVVFPGGFVYDDNYIWVVYGKQDYEIWFAKIDKQLLLSSLVPVSSKY